MEFDNGQRIDWGLTSSDYARHRPGPPESFYEKLSALGVGLPGQRIADLGTGTGVLAREFARRGCVVSGVDVAANQVEAARLLALEGRLDVDFSVAPAEETGLEDSTFDVVTANQCWLYFDLKRAISEVRRILKPGGLLVVSYFSHLPRADAVAKASEQLILRYNPHWSGADWDGRVPARPGWSRDAFELRAMFYYDEPVTFSKESWRGRVRALRGIGATLSDEKVRAFDKEHAALLDLLVDGAFTVLHRVNAHVFEFSDTSRSAV